MKKWAVAIFLGVTAYPAAMCAVLLGNYYLVPPITDGPVHVVALWGLDPVGVWLWFGGGVAVWWLGWVRYFVWLSDRRDFRGVGLVILFLALTAFAWRQHVIDLVSF